MNLDIDRIEDIIRNLPNNPRRAAHVICNYIESLKPIEPVQPEPKPTLYDPEYKIVEDYLKRFGHGVKLETVKDKSVIIISSGLSERQIVEVRLKSKQVVYEENYSEFAIELARKLNITKLKRVTFL